MPTKENRPLRAPISHLLRAQKNSTFALQSNPLCVSYRKRLMRLPARMHVIEEHYKRKIFNPCQAASRLENLSIYLYVFSVFDVPWLFDTAGALVYVHSKAHKYVHRISKEFGRKSHSNGAQRSSCYVCNQVTSLITGAMLNSLLKYTKIHAHRIIF